MGYGGHLRHALRVGIVIAAVYLAACTSPQALEGSLENPVVTLPIERATISDDRDVFAKLFEDALWELELPPDALNTQLYLHLPAANQRHVIPTRTDPPFSTHTPPERVSVLVVPGIFGDCVDDEAIPFGDGVTGWRSNSTLGSDPYAHYKDLRLAGIRGLRVPGRAGSVENGRMIAAGILTEASRPDIDTVVIVAYSKGVPDTLHALQELAENKQLPSKLKALVSVAGVVMGTPIADSFSSIYSGFGDLPKLLGCGASQGDEVVSLQTKMRRDWLAKQRPSATIKYYSLAAVTGREKVAPALQAFYDELQVRQGPNDGQVPLSHAILPSSRLLAIANSDHWDFVLPLASHSNFFIRSAASGRYFPREALFRATVRFVIATLGN